MKAFKIIGIVFWVLLTISLIFYGVILKQQNEVKQQAINELLHGMSDMLDTTYVGTMLMEFKTEIDSLESEIQRRDSLIFVLKRE